MHLVPRRAVLTVILAASTGLGLAGCALGPIVTPVARGTPATTVTPAEAKAAIDARRTARGLDAVSHHPVLQAMAEEQAAIMARSGVVAHTAEPGETFTARLRRAGFLAGAGETLAGGQTQLAEVVEGWMNSPGHRAVLLNPDYRAFGIALRRGRSTPSNTYGTYWVLIMGRAVA